MSDGFIHVDPRQQREFINALNKRVFDIGRMIEIFESRLSLLGQTWTDQEYEVFRRKIAALKAVLASFIAEGRRLSTELSRLADDAENIPKITD